MIHFWTFWVWFLPYSSVSMSHPRRPWFSGVKSHTLCPCTRRTPTFGSRSWDKRCVSYTGISSLGFGPVLRGWFSGGSWSIWSLGYGSGSVLHWVRHALRAWSGQWVLWAYLLVCLMHPMWVGPARRTPCNVLSHRMHKCCVPVLVERRCRHLWQCRACWHTQDPTDPGPQVLPPLFLRAWQNVFWATQGLTQLEFRRTLRGPTEMDSVTYSVQRDAAHDTSHDATRDACCDATLAVFDDAVQRQ